MTTIQTQHLTGTALDWAVAKCEGVEVGICLGGYLATKRQIEMTPYSCTGYEPSKNWSAAGPIIERNHIETAPTYDENDAQLKTPTGWCAMMFNNHRHEENLIVQRGDTLLQAAMRAYVHSRLGPAVDVPEELA